MYSIFHHPRLEAMAISLETIAIVYFFICLLHLGCLKPNDTIVEITWDFDGSSHRRFDHLRAARQVALVPVRAVRAVAASVASVASVKARRGSKQPLKLGTRSY